MKILLIAPESIRASKKKAILVPFPQASLTIIAGLTPKEHSVTIIDERLHEIDFNSDYDLIGITAMTATSVRAYQIADEFRKRNKKVVLGGIHPSALPDEAIQHADCVVIGEAENLWKIVLDDFQQGQLQRFYKNEELPCLTDLPPARLDLLGKGYLLKNVFQTTRGCPHNCGFCSVSTFNGRRYRHRPVENVIEEVSRCRSKMIGFLDDNIVGNPKYSKELFRALIPLKKKWVSQGTVKMAEDEELISFAQKCGCICLFVGFESVNEMNLKEMHKQFNPIEKYQKLIENFHRHHIMVVGSFVFGFDNDDISVFDNTLKFIEDTKIDFATFNILTPLPGTEVYEKFKDTNRIFSYNWTNYDFSHVVYQPAKMTPQELQFEHNELYRKFYTLPKIMKRALWNWRYLGYFLPASLYYNWVSRNPHQLPNLHD